MRGPYDCIGKRGAKVKIWVTCGTVSMGGRIASDYVECQHRTEKAARDHLAHMELVEDDARTLLR